MTRVGAGVGSLVAPAGFPSRSVWIRPGLGTSVCVEVHLVGAGIVVVVLVIPGYCRGASLC